MRCRPGHCRLLGFCPGSHTKESCDRDTAAPGTRHRSRSGQRHWRGSAFIRGGRRLLARTAARGRSLRVGGGGSYFASRICGSEGRREKSWAASEPSHRRVGIWQPGLRRPRCTVDIESLRNARIEVFIVSIVLSVTCCSHRLRFESLRRRIRPAGFLCPPDHRRGSPHRRRIWRGAPAERYQRNKFSQTGTMMSRLSTP
jgi:hypothetical protein